MYTLNDAALESWVKALDKGIDVDHIPEIISTVLEQEIVTYANSKGQVTFDYNDLIEE